MTDPNELFDEDETPPNGYPIVAESDEDQTLDDGLRADRRILLISVVAVAILCYFGYVLVSLATGDHSETSAQLNPGGPTSSFATATFEPTPSAAPPTVAPAATPIPTIQPPPVDTSTTTQPLPTPPTATTHSAPNLCGAPANPYGYNFCGGSLLYAPANDICSYLTCAANFWKSDGYVVQCQDDTFSKTGGKQKVCSQDRGYRETLFL